MNMVDDRMAKLDELSLYWPRQRPHAPQPPVASGVTFRQLYAAGLLDDVVVDALTEIVQRLESGQGLCSDQRLLDAWLYAFELRASVHHDDLAGNRTASPAAS